MVRRIVLDASVGVKWFRDEPGSVDALELLRRHGRGEIELVVPSLFVYEVVAVAARTLGAHTAEAFWDGFLSWRIAVAEIGPGLMRDALDVSQALNCSLYDAVAPALSRQLDARLCTADARAHASWPDVILVPGSAG